jgi:hypothetical protein
MGDHSGQDMLKFLGVAADPRLLDEDMVNLPPAEQRHEPAMSTGRHDRLVTAGSFMTGATLIGGGAMAAYAAWRLLFQSGGAVDIVIAAIGLVLVITHWGWVHVAEYARLTLDERHMRAADQRRREWLAQLEPYPRFSVSTKVLDDASTCVQRVLHRPLLTERGTFTFVREARAAETYEADTPAAVIAAGVETTRRQARLDTDRLRELWESASSSYEASLLSAQGDEERLAAERAAAAALSEHINASLREPPLVE